MRNKKKQRTIGKKSSPNDVAKVHPKQMKDDQTAGAILELAEPLLNSENNPAEIRFAFSIVIMGWNLSLMDGEKKIRMKETFMENAPKEMQLKDVSYLFSTMDQLAELKKKIYPDLNNLIVDHEVEVTDEKITLSVFTVPPE